MKFSLVRGTDNHATSKVQQLIYTKHSGGAASAVSRVPIMHSNKRLIRKGIHFLTGMAVLALTFLAGREAVLLLIVLGSLFAFFTFAGRRFRWLHQTADGSLGTLFYPIGVLVSFLLLYRMGFLNRGAAVAVYFLGVYFIGVLGLPWSLPMVAFFLSSVVLTRIHSAVRGKKRSSGRRSLWQVLANSVWAILFSALYLITRDPVHIYLFISVVAAVTADTWASETGPVFHRRSFSLAHGQMRTSGVSGGITAAGSLASLIGALAIAWLGHILFFGETDTPAILALALAGFFSSFADSLLAAFAEPRMRRMTLFRIPAHQHQPAPNPNDVINALGSLTAPAFFLLFRIWGNMG